nr:uncharacterized protein LOC129166788 [Nothobranchius furzeri]
MYCISCLCLSQILLVNDNAVVRRVIAAADRVSECLSELGSSSEIETLYMSFQVFSEALLLFDELTVDRAKSLQDPRQTKQLLDSLETLRKCISMLHTAMCTTIKHPTCEQAQAAKRYILDKVQSTIRDAVATLRCESSSGPLGPYGYYTEKHNNLLQLLGCYSISSIQDSSFDSMIRDIVFHCMAVANSSRRQSQQRIVSHCRHILQLWSDLKSILKFFEKPENFEETCTLLARQVQMLDDELLTALLYQVLDTFLTASSTVNELSSMTKGVLAADSAAVADLTFIQPVVEDFISSTDRIIQVASFISAVAVDAKSLENVQNSQVCLRRLKTQITPLSLELEDNSMQTVQKLHDLCQKWEEETHQLQEALSDVMDVKEFTKLATDEMLSDRCGCDEAYREQSYELFDENAKNLICHMTLVIHAVRRHLESSDNPIYRNGLLVLLKQAQSSKSKVADSVRDMLHGTTLNVGMYSTFTDNVSTVIHHFKVLREGLDGHQHPHLLSPLREGVRTPGISLPPSALKENIGRSLDRVTNESKFPAFEVMKMNMQTINEETCSDIETTDAECTHKHDSNDLKTPAVPDEPEAIHLPVAFDLLPLLYEVVTVTKGKDVSALNRACTGVLELSNCYAQASKEGSAIVDAVDCQTLESFRAELVSLTPLLVRTAQETAMGSARGTESIYKHCAQFSDLVGHIQRVLQPAAGNWYHAVFAELQRSQQASVSQNLNEVMTLCAHVVQVLMSSPLDLQGDGHETFRVLHSKLNKAQNNTRHLIEFATSLERPKDRMEGLCVLWGLSIQVLLKSLDKILGTSTAAHRLNLQKQISALSENSLRIQEAARLTSLICKSAYKSTQLANEQDELRTLTDAYIKAVEEVDAMPKVMQLAKSEFLQRQLLIKIRALSGQLSKENKEYDAAFENVVGVAYFAAEHFRDPDAEDAAQKFENVAETLVENIKAASRRVNDCLDFVRDPRARSNLRSINEHLTFQISDIISRARLVVETRYVCDTLSLDVLIQCWSAKAHYVVDEIMKQDGIHQEAKESIKAGLQGSGSRDSDHLSTVMPSKAKEGEFPEMASLQKDIETIDAAETKVDMAAEAKQEPKHVDSDDGVPSGVYKEPSSLTYTSLYLKQKSDSWDPTDNRIVQDTRKMADTICHMTQYLKKKGPILVLTTRGHFAAFISMSGSMLIRFLFFFFFYQNKEAFVMAAKDVISNCQSVTHFIRVIANHSLDKQCTVELSVIIEQILTITNQLSIVSRSGCFKSHKVEGR